MSTRLSHLRSALPEMTEQLGAITAVESPSADLAACNACAGAVARLGQDLLGAEVVVEGGPNRPPLPDTASRQLYAAAQRAAEGLGIGAITGITVGGGSDGNFTAGIGTPTLDGLGAVGDGAHAEHEHVLLDAMPVRAALLAELVSDLLRA